MSHYIEFESENGYTILVEVEEDLSSATSGLQKTSLKDALQGGVVTAQRTFEAAVGNAVRANARALLQGIQSLPEQPIQAELSFGLKATGEAGNVAVCKLSGEATYSIKLVWQPKKPDNNVKLQN